MYERDVTRMQNFQDITEEQIKSIQAPTLIIAGNQDVVTPEHALEMHRKIQHSQLLIVPGAHGDYIGELTTVKENITHYPVVQLIENFLQEKGKP